MLTIFKVPMSDDRRLGIRISANEFLDLFVVHPGKLTVQVRTDRGNYWVLSRETFEVTRHVPISIKEYRPFLPEEEAKQVWSVFQNEVDGTRAQINALR
jgi:hypothetical protein